MEFYCLMMQGVGLREHMRRTLMKEAQLMARGESLERVFLTEDFAGVLTTAFETKVISSVSGIQFEAQVESDLGKGFVRFLIPEYKLFDNTINVDDLIGPMFEA